MHISRQQAQELMALRRVFLPEMGLLLRDRQRITRALQDSQVCLSVSLSLCIRMCGVAVILYMLLLSFDIYNTYILMYVYICICYVYHINRVYYTIPNVHVQEYIFPRTGV